MIYKNGNVVQEHKNGILLHGCNMQGKMNSGVAKEVNKKFPYAYEKYKYDLNHGFSLGSVSWWYGQPNIMKNFAIASGITQEFYGTDGRRYVNYEAIYKVMHETFRVAYTAGMDVHMPKIGSGLGGGDWDIIETIIKTTAKISSFDSDKIFIWEL
jgi:O-acetyl-ADP-ribose deacetylase (regulator of RNase III)